MLETYPYGTRSVLNSVTSNIQLANKGLSRFLRIFLPTLAFGSDYGVLENGTSFLTELQSYQDNGLVIKKGCLQ